MLNHQQLETSDIVANCRMNRERQLAGVNSYEQELGFHPLYWLKERHRGNQTVRWLDLCCGRGRALVDAAAIVEQAALPIEIVGVDLVRAIEDVVGNYDCLSLVIASLHTWQPTGRFDLVTCVHGLHYLGDKLGMLLRVRDWLRVDGKFVGHLDLDNLRWEDGCSAGPALIATMRKLGMTYSKPSGRIEFSGEGEGTFPADYLGADDQAGPNRTGQPAVNSFYRRKSTTMREVTPESEVPQ